MRSLFLAAAAVHAVLVAAIMLALRIDIMILSAIGILATLAIGGVAFARGGRGAGMWAGLVAGVIALVGWGSWLVLWAIDTGRGGAVINIWGILLPALAVVVYLVAALLPATRRAKTAPRQPPGRGGEGAVSLLERPGR